VREGPPGGGVGVAGRERAGVTGEGTAAGADCPDEEDATGAAPGRATTVLTSVLGTLGTTGVGAAYGTGVGTAP
jgi:hypothetical protein